MELEQFAADFHQDVLARAESVDDENFREDAFTDLMIEYLCENGELDDAQVCSQRGHGWKVSGYGLSMDEECLDLLISPIYWDRFHRHPCRKLKCSGV